MASFVPYYRKKLIILGKREDQLRRLIAAGAGDVKLLIAAEVVRTSRIRALRAKRAEVSPADVPEFRYRIAQLQKKIEAVQRTTADNVLAEFRKTAKA